MVVNRKLIGHLLLSFLCVQKSSKNKRNTSSSSGVAREGIDVEIFLNLKEKVEGGKITV